MRGCNLFSHSSQSSEPSCHQFLLFSPGFLLFSNFFLNSFYCKCVNEHHKKPSLREVFIVQNSKETAKWEIYNIERIEEYACDLFCSSFFLTHNFSRKKSEKIKNSTIFSKREKFSSLQEVMTFSLFQTLPSLQKYEGQIHQRVPSLFFFFSFLSFINMKK